VSHDPADLLPVRYVDASTMVVDPASGDMFLLDDAPPAVLARAAAYMDAVSGEARRLRRTVGDQLQARMGRERRVDLGSHLAEVKHKNEWDEDETCAALGRLRELGLVTNDQIEQAVPEVLVRKPDGRRLNTLLSGLLGDAGDAEPEVLDAIQALARARKTSKWVRVDAASTDGTAVPA
jgi:hypothetical protein